MHKQRLPSKYCFGQNLWKRWKGTYPIALKHRVSRPCLAKQIVDEDSERPGWSTEGSLDAPTGPAVCGERSSAGLFACSLCLSATVTVRSKSILWIPEKRKKHRHTDDHLLRQHLEARSCGKNRLEREELRKSFWNLAESVWGLHTEPEEEPEPNCNNLKRFFSWTMANGFV